MKNWAVLVAVVGVGLLAAGLPAGGTIPRGIRNHNPGNIRKTGISWQGKVVPGKDDDFETFSHPVYGIRALARTLRNYQKLYGLNTVRQIINRWAPPIENNTDAYVQHVAQALKVKPDQPINVVEKLPQLIPVIIQHENGVQPYSDTLIAQGVALA